MFPSVVYIYECFSGIGHDMNMFLVDVVFRLQVFLDRFFDIEPGYGFSVFLRLDILNHRKAVSLLQLNRSFKIYRVESTVIKGRGRCRKQFP